MKKREEIPVRVENKTGRRLRVSFQGHYQKGEAIVRISIEDRKEEDGIETEIVDALGDIRLKKGDLVRFSMSNDSRAPLGVDTDTSDGWRFVITNRKAPA